ncbi:MAG TPA: hypothetical protein VM077_03965 [Candidatus Limnocylindrales bacterium]|nr:hypothetical protein [Candidatus Limnocylindrales bacterium]
MKFDSFKQNYISALIKSGGIKIASDENHLFSQRNGGKSWIYFDHGDLVCNPEGNKAFVDALRAIIEPLFPKNNTVLLNIVSRCSAQITGAIAYASSYPQIPLQAEQTMNLEKGTFRVLRLPVMKDVRNLVIPDDVLTTGNTAIETIEIVKKYTDLSKMSLHIVVGLARKPENIIDKLKEHRITPHWIATRNDVLNDIWPTLTTIQKDGLVAEFPDFKVTN